LRPGYDYIVVGSGPAGCAAARGLALGSSASVLLVEAGGQIGPECSTPGRWGETLNNPAFDYDMTTEKDPAANDRHQYYARFEHRGH